VFTDYLNYRYLIIKAKLNGKEVRWMEELITFDFMIIYCKRVKNLVDGLFRRPDFKDDSELFIIKCQSFSNFLSKFQEYLEGIKSDPVEKQSIDFDETLLFGSVLNLVKIP